MEALFFDHLLERLRNAVAVAILLRSAAGIKSWSAFEGTK